MSDNPFRVGMPSQIHNVVADKYSRIAHSGNVQQTSLVVLDVGSFVNVEFIVLLVLAQFGVVLRPEGAELVQDSDREWFGRDHKIPSA